IGGYEDVPAIKTCRAIVGVTIKWILAYIQPVSVAARIRQRLGPGICSRQLQIAFTLGYIKLHAVVIGISIRKAEQDSIVALVWTQRVDIEIRSTIYGQVSGQRRKGWLIEIRLPYQVPALITNIGRFDEEPMWQLALHAQAEVHRVGDIQIRVNRIDVSDQGIRGRRAARGIGDVA